LKEKYGLLSYHPFSRRIVFIILLIVANVAIHPAAFGEETGNGMINIEKAVICEAVQNLKPVHPAIAFSIKIGKVLCYTEFSEISQETFVFHRWYRRDELVTEKKLVLKPPQWSTYSSIQLRESDKGPWRVNIVNVHDQTMKILRFSVTE